jgi:hypothetical protein
MSEKKFSLYELNGIYLDILNNGADWDQEALQIAMESITDSIEVKVENYAKMIRHLEGEQLMLKAEEERISKRRKSLESQVKRLKEGMQLSMELTGKEKIKSSLFTIWIQESKSASVDVTNEKQLLKEYKIPGITIDKKQLLADLKAGKVVRGAKLQESSSKSVRIK